MDVSRPRTARQRAREDLTREIIETARRHLATDGASGLSLRAVARDLGMASSAIYRYVAGRDELLTLLITQAYDALGEAAEAAEAARDRSDLTGRWGAVCHAVRGWALERPHEYALLFGTPVPGYEAPEATVAPATRVPGLLVRLLVDAIGAGRYDQGVYPGVPGEVALAMAPVRTGVPDVISDELLLRGLMAWTYLFGAVSFELFGHRHHVVETAMPARDAFFAEEVARLADFVGISAVHQEETSGPQGARPTGRQSMP